ncbi:MAG: hypothetical protein K8T26_06765 [Lentisphaerae bacterium]|nr:hypothetical protein [Lentisphaerota bacterium]
MRRIILAFLAGVISTLCFVYGHQHYRRWQSRELEQLRQWVSHELCKTLGANYAVPIIRNGIVTPIIGTTTYEQSILYEQSNVVKVLNLHVQSIHGKLRLPNQTEIQQMDFDAAVVGLTPQNQKSLRVHFGNQ